MHSFGVSNQYHVKLAPQAHGTLLLYFPTSFFSFLVGFCELRPSNARKHLHFIVIGKHAHPLTPPSIGARHPTSSLLLESPSSQAVAPLQKKRSTKNFHSRLVSKRPEEPRQTKNTVKVYHKDTIFKSQQRIFKISSLQKKKSL